VIQDIDMRIKTCPICGKGFPCYADEDGRICWCEAFPRIEINDALDCLCPDCLTNKALEQGYSQNEISHFITAVKGKFTFFDE